jgi:hypothetical protein
MLTPQQNLEEADRLLRVLQDTVGNDKAMTVTDLIALANSRIALAQALHMVQLAENINKTFDDHESLRRLT